MLQKKLISLFLFAITEDALSLQTIKKFVMIFFSFLTLPSTFIFNSYQT
jgi:hypothetical protein